MTEAAKIISFRDIPKTLFRNRLLQGLVVFSVLIEIYNLAVISPYASTQKARETSAVADNAVLRQKAEADLAEAKAVNETEVARNAARRQAAEARKATALAGKTRYEAELARATAAYAEQQAKAEAEAQELQADIVKQQEQIQSQLNSYIERRKYVEAEEAEANARISQATGQIVAGGSRRSEADKARECSDKFEELWTDYQTVIHITRTSWEGERIAAKVQLYKARCGLTAEQVQRFEKAQLETLTSLEKDYCGSPASYQKEKQQEVAKLLGHMPNCRHYAGLGAQPENHVVTSPVDTQVAGKAVRKFRKQPGFRMLRDATHHSHPKPQRTAQPTAGNRLHAAARLSG